MTQPWVEGCERSLTSRALDDWLDVANTIQRKLGGPAGGAYRAFFVGKFGSLTATRPDVVQSIGKIAAAKNRIATTNYDHLISQALGWDRADWTDHLRVIEALRGVRKAVWHIHGDFDRPNSIIFSQSDYDRIAASELPQFVQRTAGLNFTLVFVGCSGSGLSDDNVGRLLDWMHEGFAGGLGDKHFVLVADSNTDPWPAGVTPVRFGDYPDLPAYLAKLAPEPIVPSTLPPNPRMIGRKDRLEELVKAILEEDRPIVVPGALGMGKTTLALAAAHDPRVIARFGKDRRFFVNLEPAPNADGALSRLATDLGLAAIGRGFRSGGEDRRRLRRRADAGDPRQSGDALAQGHGRDRGASRPARRDRGPAARHHRSRRAAQTPRPRRAARCETSNSLNDADARALFLRHAGDHFAADPALPGLLTALDGHPLSIELLAANAQGKADLRRPGRRLERPARRSVASRRGRRPQDEPARFARPFARGARSAERAASPDPTDGAVAGRHVRGRQPHDPERRRADKEERRRGGEARNRPPRQPPRRPLAPARAGARDAARRLSAGGGGSGAAGKRLPAARGVGRTRRDRQMERGARGADRRSRQSRCDDRRRGEGA